MLGNMCTAGWGKWGWVCYFILQNMKFSGTKTNYNLKEKLFHNNIDFFCLLVYLKVLIGSPVWLELSILLLMILNLYLKQYSMGVPYETLKSLRSNAPNTSNYLAKWENITIKIAHIPLVIYQNICGNTRKYRIMWLFIGSVSEKSSISYLNGSLVLPNLSM